MEKSEKSGEILTLLYEKLVSGAGIKAIVCSAQEHFENPLIVADRGCRVICAAGLPEKGDFWDCLRGGYYPAGYLRALADETGLGRIYSQAEPLWETDAETGLRSVMFRVAFGGAVAGFAQLTEVRREICAEDIELFHSFCRVAGTALCSRGSDGNAKKDYEYVISEIIGGNLYGARLKAQLASVGSEPRSSQCLFVIERAGGGRIYSEYVRSEVESIIRGCRCFEYNGKIVVLLKTRSSSLLESEMRSRFKRFLNENGLICGGSNRFDYMGELERAYRQAVTASRIGRQMEGRGPVYFLWEYTTYQMCDMLYEQCELLDFCNPMIIMIRQYDLKNNTAFVETLREYVYSGCSSAKAAIRLDVHRNTIDYRIGRMKELFDLNVDDPELMYSFRQSFQIFYYMEKNGRERGFY